jgi:7,8-dihydro-6-hydroxymethylpterin dimethyltransferase
VKKFYSQAAASTNEDIMNPFAPEQSEQSFIPDESKSRSYGCGSPVSDAEIKIGETLVDLGSGSGVECFMASAKTGSTGKVYGIDMTDTMLNLAKKSQARVAKELGYNNTEFLKGFLEKIPLPEQSANIVISNCVINLSPDKRMTFEEIFRVLKPGGRLVISDIVTDKPVPAALKNHARLRGECLGGAMQQEALLDMLRGAGFTDIRLIKRFPYRREGGMDFFSLTYSAFKVQEPEEVEVIYQGPYSSVITDQGQMLLKGQRRKIKIGALKDLEDASLLIIDPKGAVINSLESSNCCCPSSSGEPQKETGSKGQKRYQQDCMICGSELEYLKEDQNITCHYCKVVKSANAVCKESNHFVCDECHQQNGLEALKKICLATREEDMISLLKKIRSHPAIPMHGPEHHAMIPGIIVATYANRGGMITSGKEKSPVTDQTILSAIERGSKIPGGVCGFWGACGAAVGAGIAFSVLMGGSPLKANTRQKSHMISARLLAEIGKIAGPRCCQRESIAVLEMAVSLSEEFLSTPLLADEEILCRQDHKNRECIKKQCPYWEQDKAGESL